MEYNEKKLEEELLSIEDFSAMNRIVPGYVLHRLQCIDVLKGLYGKRSIYTYDTGTGKTLIAGALVNMLFLQNRNRKILFIMKNTQTIQTPEDLRIYSGLTVEIFKGTAKSVDYFKKYRPDHDILCVTPSALIGEESSKILFEIAPDYDTVIIDEAHTFSNLQHASTAMVLEGICYNADRVYALTATPIRVDTIQLARLVRIIGGEKFRHFDKLRDQLESGRIRIQDYPFLFINRNRKEFLKEGEVYTPPKGLVLWFQPMAHQNNNAGGHSMFKQNRGEGADIQLDGVNSFIQYQAIQGRRGIIFINQGSVRNAFIDFRDNNGFSYTYDVIHGKGRPSTDAYRAEVMYKFNKEKSLDVVMMSVTESLNMDCDYVVFYELTPDITQLIGRAHRGLANKQLEVYFVLTNTPKEIDYFVTNIYDVSSVIREIMDKDLSMVFDAFRAISSK